MAVLNGIGSKVEEIPLTLLGGADTHLEKAGVLVTLGSCDDVIVEMGHIVISEEQNDRCLCQRT